MTFGKFQKIAVIRGGFAGAACAHALTLAPCRVEGVDRQGQACTKRLDHGAVGITAQSDAADLSTAFAAHKTTHQAAQRLVA